MFVDRPARGPRLVGNKGVLFSGDGVRIGSAMRSHRTPSPRHGRRRAWGGGAVSQDGAAAFDSAVEKGGGRDALPGRQRRRRQALAVRPCWRAIGSRTAQAVAGLSVYTRGFAPTEWEQAMRSLSEVMNEHQTQWRRGRVSSTAMGTWQDRPYPWIVPRALWEEGLWPGIRADSDNSLPAYLLEAGVQKHSGVHNLKSSWVLCANLYFPFRADGRGRDMLAAFLRRHVAPRIGTLDRLELEYAEDGELGPPSLLGETGGSRGAGQTSPDLGLLVNGGRGLVLVENKFTERDFSGCSARSRDGSDARPGNPDPARCEDAVAVARDPCGQCHQSAWGRRYWEHLAPVAHGPTLADMPYCPAARRGYQLFRQTALAEGIAQSGKYDLTVSAVAVDERNAELDGCLRGIGVSALRRWGTVFRGRALFAVFTHQQWVGWVRAHDREGRWSDWLSWIGSRYAL